MAHAKIYAVRILGIVLSLFVFFSVPITSLAYTDINGYPWVSDGINIYLYSDITRLYFSGVEVLSQNSLQFNVDKFYTGIDTIYIQELRHSFVIPFNFDVYDYYVVGTFASGIDYGDPNLDFDRISMAFNYSDETYVVNLENLSTISFGSELVRGYSFYGLIPDAIQESNLYRFGFHSAESSLSVGGDLYLSLSVVPVEKSVAVDTANAAILQKLTEINSNTVTQVVESQKEQALMEEANETSKNIFDKISDFFDNFFSNLGETIKSWIIPTEEQLTEFLDRVNTWFSERLGFVWYPFDLAIQLVSAFAGGEANGQFTLPAFNLNVAGTEYTIWSSQTFEIDPVGIFVYVRLFTSFLLVCGVVNMAVNKYDEWIGGKDK